MDQNEVLEVLRGCSALLSGHFELRSGLHSDSFFQCAKVLQYPRLAQQLCQALVDKIRDNFSELDTAETVVAPAMGGIAVGHEIARALDCRSIFLEKKDDKLYLHRFGIKEGERVIVAEDVVTRGGRVQETIDIVRKSGGVVVAVALLVDRSGGKAEFGCPTFSLLQMEPVTYEPEKCPMCEKNMELVHPGS